METTILLYCLLPIADESGNTTHKEQESIFSISLLSLQKSRLSEQRNLRQGRDQRPRRPTDPHNYLSSTTDL